jgi:hypothetical protein
VTVPAWVSGRAPLVLTAVILSGLTVAGVAHAPTAQWLLVHATYYFLLASVLCWAGVHLHAAGELRRADLVAWVKDNWPGLLLALAVTVIAAFAVEPALRMLSDEANLVSTSKNLYASKTATVTVSGKNYYDSYWDVDVVIDRRPTLFPFLVSLLHAVRGYSYRNVFHFNLLVLAGFVFASYRLAKSLGGEVFARVAALLVVAHPITLVAARSGGFDVFSTFFALLVMKGILDQLRAPSPARLAALWMSLCLFAECRYETALFLPLVVVLLLFFKAVTWDALRPYAFIYALTPAYLLPRILQAKVLGNIPEQEPGAIAFSVENFARNAADYFRPIVSPSAQLAHATILIALGILGCFAGLRWLVAGLRASTSRTPAFQFAVVLASWILLQAVISFAYVWGRPEYPSAARLFITLDTIFSFAAAWVVTRLVGRWRPFIPVLMAAAVLVAELPVAAQHRLSNRLTQTRENSTTWRFFESLPDKRILIVTDRPNHFTIMDYGAVSFEGARRDPYIFVALERHLFQDVYVIQQIKLSTNEPFPGYEIWPDRKLEPVLQFQNDADVLVRVSRVAH